MRPEIQSPPMTEHAASKMAQMHSDVLDEVRAAVASNDVVVIGMKQNPHPPKARKALKDAGIEHTYLEYGSYLSMWKPRLAIKLWSGWPTFPQVFVKGRLIGGASETRHMIEDGSLQAVLEADRAAS